jgi:hypothetical protein
VAKKIKMWSLTTTSKVEIKFKEETRKVTQNDLENFENCVGEE